MNKEVIANGFNNNNQQQWKAVIMMHRENVFDTDNKLVHCEVSE